MSKIKENWQKLLVLATVVWAVIFYTPVIDNMDFEEGVAIILGPFVIALAIYMLFPKRTDQ